jgi:hypothetical protein
MTARTEAWALSARVLDRGFESRLRRDSLSFVFLCVLSCVRTGLVMGWSLVQGVLPYVEKVIKNLEMETRAHIELYSHW